MVETHQLNRQTDLARYLTSFRPDDSLQSRGSLSVRAARCGRFKSGARSARARLVPGLDVLGSDAEDDWQLDFQQGTRLEARPASTPDEHGVGAVLAGPARRGVDEAAPVAPALGAVLRGAVGAEDAGRAVDHELAPADVHVQQAVVDAGPVGAVEVGQKLPVMLVVSFVACHVAPAVHPQDGACWNEPAGEDAHLLRGGPAAAREVVARKGEHVRVLAGNGDGATVAEAPAGGEEVLPRSLGGASMTGEGAAVREAVSCGAVSGGGGWLVGV